MGGVLPFWDYDAVESRPGRAALEDATTQRPAPLRTEVEVNATIPVLPPVLAARIATVGGARTAKVKVADPGSISRPTRSGSRRCGRRWSRRAPAHRRERRLDLEEALEACPSWTGLRAASSTPSSRAPPSRTSPRAPRPDVPIAADESVRRAEDPLRVARAEAADVLVMKVQPLGGVTRCLELAEQAGLPVVVSSALESSVGLGAGIALAAALPELPHACGLATATLLTGDLVEQPLRAADGMLPAHRPVPSEELMSRHAADDSLAARWEERLAACAAQL